MSQLLLYQPLLDLFLIGCGFAFSQYVVLRAGVFSVATAGFASIGAYTTAVLVMKYSASPVLALILGSAFGLVMGLALSIPLARLRGVYQAIATLAFVQAVEATMLLWGDMTGGALGISGIPRLVNTWHLLLCVAIVVYLMISISRTQIGRSFDAIRQDEVAAAAMGISVTRYHAFAFALSGAIAGLFGGLSTLYSFNISPHFYGFPFVVAVLSYVVFGGRATVYGPLVGTACLFALPEVFRPFAENRALLYGALLMIVIIFLPSGLADSVYNAVQKRRALKAHYAGGANV